MASTATADAPVESQQTTKSTAKPIAQVQYGAISVAAFAREVTKSDETFTIADFNIRKSFKKADGQWDHVSMSIGRKDVFNLIQALTDCYTASYSKDATDSDDDE